MTTILIVIAIVLAVFLFIYFKFFKLPKLSTINFIDGEVGSGKTQLTVYWSIKAKHKQEIICFIKNVFYNFFHKTKKCIKEKPELYSNINLVKQEFSPFTKDLLTRQNYRCAINSIGCLDECSLVADQNIYGKQFKDVCEQMRDFWKLCRHEGFKHIFVNSQSMSSVNYTLKDVLGRYFYIHSRTRLPFFSLLKIREFSYSRDMSAGMVNNSDTDFESTLKCYIVPNRIFKKYDSRCYSIFTDNLPVYRKHISISKKSAKKDKALKKTELVSFIDFNYLYQNLEKGVDINE